MVWHKAASVSDFSSREVIGLEVAGVEVAIYNLDGEYRATNNICPHQRAFMSDGYVEDGKVECPLHQAIFDIRTGQALEGPTRLPLPTYQTKVEGDFIFIDLP